MRASGAVFQTDPGLPLWRQLRHFPAAEVAHGLAQVNHYAVKTWDSYLLRQARGRGAAPLGSPNDRHDRAYFEALAAATVPDDTIQGYRTATDALLAEMHRDPMIAAAAAEVVSRYKARLAGLQ
jgi:hypothetical protein